MDIETLKRLEEPVSRKIEAHHGTQEVVADTCRLTQVPDEAVAIKRAHLTDALARGYQDVAVGRVIHLDSDGEIDTLFANL